MAADKTEWVIRAGAHDPFPCSRGSAAGAAAPARGAAYSTIAPSSKVA